MNMNVGDPSDRPRHEMLWNLQRVMAPWLILATSLFATDAIASLPAFPGAEGSGALAVGGRGGGVCKVTNLNDSGSGSLRECIEMSGPRTVIFDVGGTIVLNTGLTIQNPYITIAGQTAPGGGIQIRASKTNWNNAQSRIIRVATHDVIIRFLRLRAGSHPERISNANQSWASDATRIIWDHMSLAWSFDGTNWSAWNNPNNITLQNSIVAEGRVNILTGAGSESSALATKNLDFHNNLIANASHRNPLLKNDSIRFINNIVYNWSAYASRTSGGVRGDFISNVYTPGPAPKGSRARQELHFNGYSPEMASPDRAIQRDPSLYVVGNRGGQSGMDAETDNWGYTREVGPSENGSIIGLTPLKWRRFEPLAPAGVPITVRRADDLENHVLALVGASKRIDCEGRWVFNRDAVDARIIDEYRNFGGLVPSSSSHEDDFGGFPLLERGVPCIDTSGDGIPDEWAKANGLNHADPSLGRTVHQSGYTYLELYINGMGVGNAKPAAPAAVKVE